MPCGAAGRGRVASVERFQDGISYFSLVVKEGSRVGDEFVAGPDQYPAAKRPGDPSITVGKWMGQHQPADYF